MKKVVTLSALIAIVVIAYSCKKNNDKLTAAAYLDLPATPYSYTFVSPDTAYNHKATLGRVLFYDTHLSVNNAISCGSCHKQALGFADNAALSVGYEGRLTKRNSKGIVNLGSSRFSLPNTRIPGSPLFWDGREEIVADLVARPITNHVEMGIDDVSVLPAKLSKLAYYSELFKNAYGDNAITMDRISDCVATFLISIQSNDTRFDKFFNNGQTEAFTALEKKGYDLFTTKYNCEGCHHLFQNFYTTDDFKDIGLDNNYKDLGRGAVTTASIDNGKFRTPSLRNVELTAPYMHDGRFKTLDDVLEHYSHNIQNSPNLNAQFREPDGTPKQLNISDMDKQALIAFLKTTTDYTLITDPKFSNPFKLK